MACPVSGYSAPPQMAENGYNEKFHLARESDDSIDESKPEHSYGIDTGNFYTKLISPDFKPVYMQKIVQEGIILAGGATAILLQMASPGVAAGVNRHSNFAYRVQDRLRTTMTFVYCMAFGSPEEKRAIINMVHRAHDPVKGEDYDAHDAELQLWVAATLYVVASDLYQKIFGKFDEITSQKVYEEYAMLACTLRVPPEMWPKTIPDFWTYWNDKIATMPITADALAVKQDMLFNDKLPLWIRINMPALRVATVEWLPPSLREPYGFPKESRSRRIKYKVIYGITKATYPFIPRFIRAYPVKFYLKDMRKRLAAGGHIIGPDEKTT